MSTIPGNIYINNDTYVTISGLQNGSNSSYFNGATVTMTLKDLAGSDVSGVAWPVSLSYEAASNGNYNGVVDKAVSLTHGNMYFLEVTAAQDGIDAFWRIPMVAAYRDS